MNIKLLLLLVIVFSLACNQDKHSSLVSPTIEDVVHVKLDTIVGYSSHLDESNRTLLVPPENPLEIEKDKIEFSNSHSSSHDHENFFKTGTPVPAIFEEVSFTQKALKKCVTPIFKDDANLNIMHFGELQGLVNENINSIFQDKEGNLWICTYGHGIMRYDGEYFRHYLFDDVFLNNQVRFGFEDHDGNLWFGTYNLGIYRFDGENFTRLQIEKDKPFYNVNSMMLDDQGEMWFGVDNFGLLKLSNSSYTIYSKNEGLSSNRVSSVTQDSEGNTWIGTWDSGISMFDGKTFTKGVGDSDIRALFSDSIGNIWFGTWGDGIIKMDSTSFRYITEKDGLSSNMISSIYADNPNFIWISTLSGGLNKLDLNSFKHISKEFGFEGEQVSSIAEDPDGNIWMSTYDDGLFKFNGKNFRSFRKEEGMCSNKLASLLADKNGNIWAGSLGNGVTKFDGESFTNYDSSSGLSGDFIWSIIEDKSGAIWFSSFDGGVTKYDGETFIHFGEDEGLSDAGVWTILEDSKGNIWFGTHGQGVSKFDGEHITHYTVKEGFSGELVWDMFEDSDENIWFSTYKNGAIRFNGEEFSNYFLNEETKIKSVNEDDSKNIWVSTDNGVKVLMPKQEKNDYFTIPISILDGLRNKSSFLASALIDKNNYYWLGTPKTLCYLDLNTLTFDKTLPSPTLRQLKVNSEIVSIKEEGSAYNGISFSGLKLFENYPENLELSSVFNSLSFFFSASDVYSPHRIQYSYRLNGYDKKWSSPGHETKKEYNNLPHGSYKFLVKARRNNGGWGETFKYEFTIHAPWYKTNLAYFGYFISAFLFYICIIKWRTSHLKNRQLELVSQVEFATRKISAQKENVEHQKKIIEIAHQEITDSIKYAKRIQNAILPSLKEVKETLPQSFIYYQPKDVVAGDFYWMKKIGEKIFIAVGDCTGHGVPGAMVSVVCNNGLNRSVREYGLTDPGEILDKTRELVITEFEKSEEDVKDGMDVALCCFDGQSLKYSGANIPLWIINEGQMMVTKPNKQPIGKFDNPRPFTTYSIDLNAGDTIYLFSDGYTDQFGGARDKKFKKNSFQRLLISIQELNMEEQVKIIQKTFDNWKGDNEQIDDVCVVGVKAPRRIYESESNDLLSNNLKIKPTFE